MPSRLFPRTTRRSAAALGLVALLAPLAACGDATAPGPDAPLASLAVTTDTVRLVAGDTARLLVRALARGGGEVAEPRLAWSSTRPDLVRVDADGRVTAVGGFAQPNVAAVVAAGAGAADTVPVEVYPRAVDSLYVGGSQMLLPGRSVTLSANPLVAGARVFAVAARWASSNLAVASVAADGTLTARRPGTATVTAGVAGRLASLPVQVLAAGYRLTDLGTLGGDSVSASALNDLGQVVGVSTTAAGEARGFLWEEGAMRDLGAFHPQRLNERGQVAGTAPAPRGGRVPAVWEGGAVRTLPFAALESAPYAVDLDESGRVLASDGRESFLWEGGAPRRLGTPTGVPTGFSGVRLNERGTVAGSFACPPECQPYLWLEGRFSRLGGVGAGGVAITDLNDAGAVVGTVAPAGRRLTRGFVWRDGAVTWLGDLGRAYTRPLAIDEGGEVVGSSLVRGSPAAPPPAALRGFLWRDGMLADLNALLETPGWEVREAVDVNEEGEILAHAVETRSGRRRAVLLTPAP